MDTPPAYIIVTAPIIDNVESMETTHEDTNPDSEVLYTMNIDTQEVNIMVDKKKTKKRDMENEPPIENIAVETNIKDTVGNFEIEAEKQTKQSTDPLVTGKTDVHPKQLATDSTNKSIEMSAIDNLEVNRENLVENTKSQSEKLAMDSIEKQTEVHIEKSEEEKDEVKVNVENVQPTSSEKPKPLLVEMQTETNLPEVTISKEVTHTDRL